MYTQDPFSHACIAALGSMTAAIKAQRILLSHGYSAAVIALSPEQTRRGCAYGVSFACKVEAEVRRALRAGGVSVSQYIKRTNEP